MNIKKIKIKNFMLFDNLELFPARFNLFIGANDTGKTIILKLIYAVSRAYQEYKEKQKKNFSDILSSKILWTFLPDNLGNLVKKGSEKAEILFETELFNLRLSFSRKAKAEIKDLSLKEIEGYKPYTTLFIPPKEAISMIEAIRVGREEKEKYWFDDTYYTLAQALSYSPSRGRLSQATTEMIKTIKEAINGDMEKEGEAFYLRRDRYKYEIQIVAEGLRKMGMFEWLIKNKTLKEGTIFIMDEPESGLNPMSIVVLSKAIYRLSQMGLFVFAATHNFFLLKKVQILSRKDKNENAKIFVFEKDNERIITNETILGDVIPSNKILDIAMDLYNEDVKLVVEDILK